MLLFSCPVVSDSLWPRGLQHTRLPHLSLSYRVCSNPCPLYLWYHPTISSPCHLLLLLPSVFPSIRVFSSESAFLIRWPKYWSFSISPSSEYSRADFLEDWLIWSCYPRHSQESSPTPSPKASILQCSAFFMVQLSHPYMTTGKTIALTRWTFVSKVLSLLFNTFQN